MNKFIFGTALVTLMFATSANAAIVLGPGNGNLWTFNDNPARPSNYVGPDSGNSYWDPGPISWNTTGANSFVVNGSVTNQYLAPLGDTTNYLFATPGSDAIVSWGKNINSFVIRWGSPDDYNTLTLSNGDSVTGTQIGAFFGFTANGNNANTRWVTIYDRTPFTGFTASSTGVAFEFDGTAVPEPSSWALMLSGFAALGFAGYRSRKKVAA
ncbi:PEP-CTERM sorting domain-containing protein [uncultured Rhodoblastus sp.]|uniref:PEP-CTERM sorting domain-containing protein n=1 Tax=uncultured Rhodoblastus sp. TaxID=543037 RepID=UPI0025E40925|nr:PEP-CTERM sorting domain-containing protein [uncultured Rhodoblastus sp.]